MTGHDQAILRRAKGLVHTSVDDAKSSIDCWLSRPCAYGGNLFNLAILSKALELVDGVDGQTSRRQLIESRIRKIEKVLEPYKIKG